MVKIDGSGRLTLRNRQHLRTFTPFNTQPQDVEALSPAKPAEQPNRPRQVLHPTASPSNMPESTNDGTSPPPCNSSPEAVCPPISTTAEEVMPSLPNSPETLTEPPPSSTPQRTIPITMPKMPRALARLQPHNPLDIKGDPLGTTTRGSRHMRN